MPGSYEYQIGLLTAIHEVLAPQLLAFYYLRVMTGTYIAGQAITSPDWSAITQSMMRVAQKPQVVLCRRAAQTNRVDVIDLQQVLGFAAPARRWVGVSALASITLPDLTFELV